MTITVAVAGAAGKMGREVIRGIFGAPDLALVGGVDPASPGGDCGELAGVGHRDAPVVERLSELPGRPQVIVDFTHPTAVKENCLRALGAGIRPVVGTTGMHADDIVELAQVCDRQGVGCLVAPNFALGAVLLMKFAAEAAKYFDCAEIIELHHNQKADAPSGTAIKTAELMRASRERFGLNNAPEKETLRCARGADFDETGIQIHSVRLPGLVAHQEVLFGGLGQTLTLRHDSLSRESFIPGVLLGIRKVVESRGLVYGLEHLL
ncbi:MAG: 4-hydroxy-tetrahydrodipicolinate reductase [Candidatus Sericytochromatia bacterium]|nr:4-hydroxy-tetrahydrodipicolinate reductase [Candidatus Tanganyikabacteria bacterium]